METYTHNDITKIYDTLPEYIQEALASKSLTNATIMLGQAHNLHIDQIDTLIQEVDFALAGITKSENFIDRLEYFVRIPREEAVKLAGDIDSIVFNAVREVLRDSGSSEEGNEHQTKSDEYIPESEHTNIRNELLSAIEGNDTLSTTVLGKTDPIFNYTNKPMDTLKTNYNAPQNQENYKIPLTKKSESTDAQPVKTRPGFDPYREPIEAQDIKPVFKRNGN